jgi:branched-chain amino acid transport system substrate-binding protein
MHVNSIRRACALALAAALIFTACGGSDHSSNSAPTSAGGQTKNDKVGNVRGFDGTTIKLAAIGIKGQLPGVEWGAKGRIKHFNDSNEVPGVKLQLTEYVDDKFDPANTLSEARRLVTDSKVFGLVDFSSVTPGDYLKQQHVPYFGFAFDFTYCSATGKPDESIWGFGFDGCLIPQKPKVEGDLGGQLYEYVSKETHKQHPTLAMFGNDTQSGRNAVNNQAVAYKGAGFDIVMHDGIIPPPPVSDYTPYVQKLLKADGGKAPDAMICLLQVDCIPVWGQLKAAGYKGVYGHSLYSDALTKAMEGTVANAVYANLSDPSPDTDRMRADIQAVKADQQLETGSVAAYFSVDMFIQALKTVAKGGKGNITPENIQKAAMHQTWRFGEIAGPTKYPASTVTPTPACAAVVRSDGTKWNTVVPYSCSDKQFKVEG